MNFQKIYDQVKEEFKTVIKDELSKDAFFTSDEGSRSHLLSEHLKPLPLTAGSKPEPTTSRFILKLLSSIGIEDAYIIPEVRLRKTQFARSPLNKYPDFGVLNKEEGKSLLFEVESLNKPLDSEDDEEGITQARSWFREFLGLHEQYNAVITNFNEWYLLKHDENTFQMEAISKSPSEILEIIRDIALGKERPYLEEEGEIVTKEFYQEFSRQITALLDPNDSSIAIRNITDDDSSGSNLSQIAYYRTVFFRMLFVKILLDWKLLPFDPIQEVFNNEQPRNYFNCVKALFFEVLNNQGERIDVLEKFKELPYLNGGLFRLSEVELNNPNVCLNSNAIKEIWDLLRKYNFVLHETNASTTSVENSINPSILGYIFEKSIGDIRKETGTYYTRAQITRYISRNTLERCLIDKINSKFKKEIPWELTSVRELKMYDIPLRGKIYEYSGKLLKSLKVCDPAVGSGAFLVSIANLLLEYYTFFMKIVGLEELKYQGEELDASDKRPFKDLVELKTFIVQNNLYGVDINPSAVEICELRLWLWIVQPPPELDTIGIDLSPLPNIEYNIREGNSLFGYTKGIKSIKVLDSKTKKEARFTSLSEWVGKKTESLSKMLVERNEMIKSYYSGSNEEERASIRDKLKELTDRYTKNFNQLLLEEYQLSRVVSREITVTLEEVNDFDFEDTYSTLIRLNEGETVSLSEEEKDSLRKDTQGQTIRGITIRGDSISLSFRAFNPNKQDRFIAQNPRDLTLKCIDAIGTDIVHEVRIQKLVTLEELESLNPFHWSMEFSDFFTTKGFDIIVTNPPYGNILRDLEKKILSEDITEDIYLNFLLKLCRKDIPFQYAGVLVPKSHLLRQKYTQVRNELLSSVGIYEITDIGSKQFIGATNEVQILFFHASRKYSDAIKITDLFDLEKRIEHQLTINKGETLVERLRICQNPDCKYYDGASSFYYYTTEERCPHCDAITLALNRIRIKATEDVYTLITKIENEGDINFLNTMDFPKMLRGEEESGLTLVREQLEDSQAHNCAFLSARDDFSYYYYTKTKSFDLENIPSSALKGDDYEYYTQPKLLIKHNSIVPVTIYTEESVCFSASIYSLLAGDNMILKYLSGLYNSILMQFYCTFGINNQKDTTINLNQYMIRHLPVVIPSTTNRSYIIERVEKLHDLFRDSEGELTNEIIQVLIDLDNTVFKIYDIEASEQSLIRSLVSSKIDFFGDLYKTL